MQSAITGQKRRRGGQPGNTNRLIHGRYSKRLSRPMTSPPNPFTGHDPDLEIAMARVHLRQLLLAQEAAPKRQWLSYERAIIDCLGLIVSLISAHNRNPDRRRLEAAIEALRRQTGEPTEFAPGILNLIRTWPEDDPPLP